MEAPDTSRYVLASRERCRILLVAQIPKVHTQHTFREASLAHTNHEQHTNTSTAPTFNQYKRNKPVRFQQGICAQ